MVDLLLWFLHDFPGVFDFRPLSACFIGWKRVGDQKLYDSFSSDWCASKIEPLHLDRHVFLSLVFWVFQPVMTSQLASSRPSSPHGSHSILLVDDLHQHHSARPQGGRFERGTRKAATTHPMPLPMSRGCNYIAISTITFNFGSLNLAICTYLHTSCSVKSS